VSPPFTFAVLIPVYDDWDAVTLLLKRFDAVLESTGLQTRVLLVDDGSNTPIPDELMAVSLEAIRRIDVMTLRRNLGHQRAIAVALAFMDEKVPVDAVVVMDGDGEDAPEDVPRLLAAARQGNGRHIVFAERRRRSESLAFRVLYHAYRWVHLGLTGIPVRVGNFSVVPRVQLQKLVAVSELWNHYAAAVFKARLPRTLVPTTRGHRLSGRSRMNFVSLVGHGLSALSVHAELIGVRMLVLTVLLTLVVCGLLATVVALKMWTSLAIPGWATSAAGLLVLVLFQMLAFAIVFIFLVLHARSHPAFLPVRDYGYFVSGIVDIFPRTEVAEFTPARPSAAP
jgi:hypothetical protein